MFEENILAFDSYNKDFEGYLSHVEACDIDFFSSKHCNEEFLFHRVCKISTGRKTGKLINIPFSQIRSCFVIRKCMGIFFYLILSHVWECYDLLLLNWRQYERKGALQMNRTTGVQMKSQDNEKHNAWEIFTLNHALYSCPMTQLVHQPESKLFTHPVNRAI